MFYPPYRHPPLSDTPPAALPILFCTNSKVVEKTHLHPNVLLLLDEGIHGAKASSSDIRLAKGSLGLARRNYWMLIHLLVVSLGGVPAKSVSGW
jgi:hypothetical protein